MKNKCLGCGAIKQTNDPNNLGYVKEISHEYCLDCFNLMHYGRSLNDFNPTSYSEIDPNSIVLITASVMQLDLLFSLPIEKIQNDAKYIYLINKTDLLPKDTNLDYLIKEIVKKAYINKINYEDIILMSAINPKDITNLKNHLNTFKTENIYLFGYQNSGKSTLFKALTNNKTVLNLNKIGLTKEIITEKLNDKLIHDMPGDYIKGTLADLLDYESYKKLLPVKEIKTKMYFVTNKQKLMINDFIEITVLTKNNPLLVLYINDFNKVDKYNINNLKQSLNEDYEYTNKIFKLSSKQKYTITIADFVFINIKEDVTINVKYPKKLRVTSMESFIK